MSINNKRCPSLNLLQTCDLILDKTIRYYLSVQVMSTQVAFFIILLFIKKLFRKYKWNFIS
jgi:hypothetical protein